MAGNKPTTMMLFSSASLTFLIELFQGWQFHFQANIRAEKMSLWVDKYRPNCLSKLDYHLEQAERLQKMIAKGNFPHLLVYGPPGAGKKTRIMALLRELYGPGVEKLRMEHQNFTVINLSPTSFHGKDVKWLPY